MQHRHRQPAKWSHQIVRCTMNCLLLSGSVAHFIRQQCNASCFALTPFHFVPSVCPASGQPSEREVRLATRSRTTTSATTTTTTNNNNNNLICIAHKNRVTRIRFALD